MTGRKEVRLGQQKHMECKNQKSLEVPLPTFLQKTRKIGEDELDALANHKGARGQKLGTEAK